MHRILSFAVVGTALTLMSTPLYAQDKDPQLVPNRISGVGDSITEAINAEEFNIFRITNPNPWASFSNGYYGFWEWLLGRTNVDSHNQRISRNFGSRGRANFLDGVSGADSTDLAAQTAASVDHSATYVTMFMGHNDVCGNDFSDIPTDAEYEANVRAGLENLRTGLPDGATIYLIGLVDIYELYQLGDQLTSLGLIDCRLIWATSLFNIFPCGTMLSPTNSEADRQFTRSRNIAFNQILERLANEYNDSDPHHYYAYTNEAFDYAFQPSEVSGFDCFHPSATGQRMLSDVTWDSGPFRQFQR
ncbi:MAG: SGNH/GDSL hydrolase family protein [Myxococcota bacterium]